MKITVVANPEHPGQGILSYQPSSGPLRTMACAIGRSGISANRVEGDGTTPAGTLPLLRILYRPDRLDAPKTQLPMAALSPDDIWCDDKNHPLYNQQAKRPLETTYEDLWREDHLYDIIGVLDYNLPPAIPGLGSCIFLHVARDSYGPTAGCVALALPDLLELLAACRPGDSLDVRLP